MSGTNDPHERMNMFNGGLDSNMQSNVLFSINSGDGAQLEEQLQMQQTSISKLKDKNERGSKVVDDIQEYE